MIQFTADRLEFIRVYFLRTLQKFFTANISVFQKGHISSPVQELLDVQLLYISKHDL